MKSYPLMTACRCFYTFKDVAQDTQVAASQRLVNRIRTSKGLLYISVSSRV